MKDEHFLWPSLRSNVPKTSITLHYPYQPCSIWTLSPFHQQQDSYLNCTAAATAVATFTTAAAFTTVVRFLNFFFSFLEVYFLFCFKHQKVANFNILFYLFYVFINVPLRYMQMRHCLDQKSRPHVRILWKAEILHLLLDPQERHNVKSRAVIVIDFPI